MTRTVIEKKELFNDIWKLIKWAPWRKTWENENWLKISQRSGSQASKKNHWALRSKYQNFYLLAKS